MRSRTCDSHHCDCNDGHTSWVPTLRDTVMELAELVRESGGVENLSDEVRDLLSLVAEHVKDTTMIARKRRRESGAAGFDEMWGHVSNLVRLGGAAFADDVVSGASPQVAAERHEVSPQALAAAIDYAEAVRSIRGNLDAVETLARAARADLLAILQPAPPAEEPITPTVRWVDGESKPRERSRPGHGWPVTSLAPPVAA